MTLEPLIYITRMGDLHLLLWIAEAVLQGEKMLICDICLIGHIFLPNHIVQKQISHIVK